MRFTVHQHRITHYGLSTFGHNDTVLKQVFPNSDHVIAPRLLPAARAPCEVRAVRFVGLLSVKGWNLKVYRISPFAETRLGEAIASIFPPPLSGLLDQIAVVNSSGTGFVSIEADAGGTVVSFGWWPVTHELNHRAFVASCNNPHDFFACPSSESAANVWDLGLICFEREAWIRYVLRNPDGPNMTAYLAARFEGVL